MGMSKKVKTLLFKRSSTSRKKNNIKDGAGDNFFNPVSKANTDSRLVINTRNKPIWYKYFKFKKKNETIQPGVEEIASIDLFYSNENENCSAENISINRSMNCMEKSYINECNKCITSLEIEHSIISKSSQMTQKDNKLLHRETLKLLTCYWHNNKINTQNDKNSETSLSPILYLKQTYNDFHKQIEQEFLNCMRKGPINEYDSSKSHITLPNIEFTITSKTFAPIIKSSYNYSVPYMNKYNCIGMKRQKKTGIDEFLIQKDVYDILKMHQLEKKQKFEPVHNNTNNIVAESFVIEQIKSDEAFDTAEPMDNSGTCFNKPCEITDVHSGEQTDKEETEVLKDYQDDKWDEKNIETDSVGIQCLSLKHTNQQINGEDNSDDFINKEEHQSEQFSSTSQIEEYIIAIQAISDNPAYPSNNQFDKTEQTTVKNKKNSNSSINYNEESLQLSTLKNPTINLVELENVALQIPLEKTKKQNLSSDKSVQTSYEDQKRNKKITWEDEEKKKQSKDMYQTINIYKYDFNHEGTQNEQFLEETITGNNMPMHSMLLTKIENCKSTNKYYLETNSGSHTSKDNKSYKSSSEDILNSERLRVSKSFSKYLFTPRNGRKMEMSYSVPMKPIKVKIHRRGINKKLEWKIKSKEQFKDKHSEQKMYIKPKKDDSYFQPLTLISRLHSTLNGKDQIRDLLDKTDQILKERVLYFHQIWNNWMCNKKDKCPFKEMENKNLSKESNRHNSQSNQPTNKMLDPKIISTSERVHQKHSRKHQCKCLHKRERDEIPLKNVLKQYIAEKAVLDLIKESNRVTCSGSNIEMYESLLDNNTMAIWGSAFISREEGNLQLLSSPLIPAERYPFDVKSDYLVDWREKCIHL